MNVVIGAISQGLLWAIMAIGIYITYRILDIADLTAEGVFALGASVLAHYVIFQDKIDNTMIFRNPTFGTVLAILAGVIAGVVTGTLHTKLKIPSLLAGILTMTALYSINLRIMGKANVGLVNSERERISIFSMFRDMFSNADGSKMFSENTSTIILGFIVLFFVILLLFLFFKTELGFTLRATGNNASMARALGVNTNNMIIIGLIISNGLIGLSSALVAQSNGYADVSMGKGTIVIGLSSVIIGEVVYAYLFEKLFKVRSIVVSLISVTLGSITYRLIIALVLQLGLNTDDINLISSIILTIALVIPLIEDKYKVSVSLRNSRRDK